ncbi:Ni/Fe hydrogenase subunit gamma [Thioalkalivibrio denitrificans]|uniref:Ni/Fe hydrogenase subunit gamma n=1 Tax=Thioalkalivibrio denitrificans TaxID=108003 RepID=A0A1V3NKF5_9GAMM|nr:FAD/NAD(P)-binding protein [Thioalkalivibrio denitrificans]OOG25599.1 Ni/Fe hydrogenase subunit gamma [Thioalkalivibrio denitrificans]
MSVSAAEPAHEPMAPEPWRIRQVRREVADGEVFTWTMEPLSGEAAVARPGQFNMLYLFGVGEVAISISALADDGTPVHTIRAVGSVTRAMQDLGPGDVVGLRGPFGSAWPVAAAEGRDLVLAAGGIGLAPLRPVVHAVLARREAFGRVLVCYGARSPRDLIFRDELEQWRANPDLDLRVTVDRGTADWKGDVGVVTQLIDRGGFDGRNAIAMVCGPEVMMRFSALSLHRRGIAPERIHVSMERSMRCALGFCGHCQIGPHFVCRDGPVFPYPAMEPAFRVNEL